ncbi:unnamed protein product [Ceratitis capitata]|uniref:(Mediterranean fruit fly) hypothetical protein n=1 Tax=Ceratitis capitata TaxID=7213 RepID=A0A811UUC9_CERCA|nr:unnamed protein product [Ceratitis capitata]
MLPPYLRPKPTQVQIVSHSKSKGQPQVIQAYATLLRFPHICGERQTPPAGHSTVRSACSLSGAK